MFPSRRRGISTLCRAEIHRCGDGETRDRLGRMDDAIRAALVAAWLASAAHAAAGEPLRRSIAPGGFDEHCLKIEAGRAIAYRFEASAPVDFNIHHHRGKDVLYPVRRESTRQFASTFRAESTDEYCLMWENKGGVAATVEARIEWR